MFRVLKYPREVVYSVARWVRKRRVEIHEARRAKIEEKIIWALEVSGGVGYTEDELAVLTRYADTADGHFRKILADLCENDELLVDFKYGQRGIDHYYTLVLSGAVD